MECVCWGRPSILTLKLESIHHRVQRSLEVQEVHADKTSTLLREADEEGKRQEHAERGDWRCDILCLKY